MTLDFKNTYYKGAEKLLVAVDCIIFGFDDQKLKLLLFKRKVAPFKGEWSLIGSFIKEEESVLTAANQVLKESTGLTDVYLEELGSYGEPERDPGARVISMAHYALIQADQHNDELAKQYHSKWFDFDDLPPLILDHEQMVKDALEKLRVKARYRPIGFELLSQKFTIPHSYLPLS